MNEVPDDYFNNGQIEMARFGSQIVLKNNMTLAQNQRVKVSLKKTYPKIKRKIKHLVLSIRSRVCKCDPIKLLSFSSDVFLTCNLGISSEFQLTGDNISSSRMTEYLQSIFVSSELKHTPSKNDPSKQFFCIQKDIEKLYKLIHSFYACWIANADELYPDYNEELKRIVFESQLLYLVRGQRYQIYEIEYYDRLLSAHNDFLMCAFGITTTEIIEGIKRLQYALSQGKLDVVNELGELFDSFYENGETNIEKFRQEHLNQSQSISKKLFGTKLHDVIEITGWPEKFVAILSYKLNECTYFFNDFEFAGWPIIDLPIQKRPFIALDNHYYCFDYYSFMDNFYRCIQKAISREYPEYKWSDFQKEASENMVAKVFSEILPGCTEYRDNYYPQQTSLKELRENDLIVIYGDILFIIEVKAGSFVYTPPLTDFENHIRSYKSLVEKANHQCKNTYDYLLSHPHAILYNQDSSEKVCIDMSAIRDVYMFSVTVDNINDFAARAEKLNFLQLKCNAISISIDDLMVYRDYFDSPLFFLHFLKQRRKATLEKKLALNDELDHLGMYIKNNVYCLQFSDIPDDSELVFQGYREELDKYFSSLYYPQLHVKKPSQTIHPLILEIIHYLEKSSNRSKIEISNYFLDFSSEAKLQFCESVEYARKRQLEIGNMIAFNTAGNGENTLRYTAFIEQENVKLFTEKYKRDYVLSTLIWNNENERVMITLKFNRKNQLDKISFNKLKISDIAESKRETLQLEGKERARMRVQLALKANKNICDDEMCPCGSGLVYQKCCKEKFG